MKAGRSLLIAHMTLLVENAETQLAGESVQAAFVGIS